MIYIEDHARLTIDRTIAYSDRLEKERVRARNIYAKHKQREKPRIHKNAAAKNVVRDAAVKLLKEANATMVSAVESFTPAALHVFAPLPRALEMT
jgi:hypothetical protein